MFTIAQLLSQRLNQSWFTSGNWTDNDEDIATGPTENDIGSNMRHQRTKTSTCYASL